MEMNQEEKHKQETFPQKRGLNFSGSRRVASGEQLVFKLHLRFYPAATIIQANWHITNTATANSTLLLSSSTRRPMARFFKSINFLATILLNCSHPPLPSHHNSGKLAHYHLQTNTIAFFCFNYKDLFSKILEMRIE